MFAVHEWPCLNECLEGNICAIQPRSPMSFQPIADFDVCEELSQMTLLKTAACSCCSPFEHLVFQGCCWYASTDIFIAVGTRKLTGKLKDSNKMSHKNICQCDVTLSLVQQTFFFMLTPLLWDVCIDCTNWLNIVYLFPGTKSWWMIFHKKQWSDPMSLSFGLCHFETWSNSWLWT